MIDGWTLTEAGFDAVAGGLRKTYARGRRALDSAVEAPTSENFHEYRKRTKYTWYHVRLLDETAPALAKSFGNRLHELSDTLGDEHDLAVLSEQLRRDPEEYGGDSSVAAALLLVEGQRADLQRRALGAGVRLHAETPDAFVARFAAYWDAWHRFGPPARIG
jgi:CHAD domain-containing protein